MTDKERPDQRPLAKPTVQVENDRVIVTEWRFPPGGKRHSVTMTRSFSTWTVGLAKGS